MCPVPTVESLRVRNNVGESKRNSSDASWKVQRCKCDGRGRETQRIRQWSEGLTHDSSVKRNSRQILRTS